MKRKLVKQGAATLMVSLPSKWIKANGLDKGSEIDLEEQGKKIILSNSNTSKQTIVKKLDITGSHLLTNRIILAEYVRGVDELEVSFSKIDELKAIQKNILSELIGFEIIKQSQNKVLIKDITGLDNQDIDEIIRRIFFILDSMLDELIISIAGKKSLDPVTEIDQSVNKFVSFCLRILNKRGYKDSNFTPQVYSIVSQLEEVGDSIKEYSIHFGKKESKGSIDVLREIRGFLKTLETLFFSFNKDQLYESSKNYELINKKIKDDFYLRQILQSMVKINSNLLIIKN